MRECWHCSGTGKCEPACIACYELEGRCAWCFYRNNPKALTPATPDNHNLFLAHLEASEKPRKRVAQLFRESGFTVRQSKLRKAPRHADWRGFVDHGDLFVSLDGTRWLRIEIKHLSRYFTDIENWPFPDFIVCAKHSFDEAAPKPHAYLILNRRMTHAAIVFGSQRREWTITRRNDSRYSNIQQEFYVCEPSQVKAWVELTNMVIEVVRA